MNDVKVQTLDPQYRKISLTIMLGSESDYTLEESYDNVRPRRSTVTKFIHLGGTYVQAAVLFQEIISYRRVSYLVEV